MTVEQMQNELGLDEDGKLTVTMGECAVPVAVATANLQYMRAAVEHLEQCEQVLACREGGRLGADGCAAGDLRDDAVASGGPCGVRGCFRCGAGAGRDGEHRGDLQEAARGRRATLPRWAMGVRRVRAGPCRRRRPRIKQAGTGE